MTPLTKRQRAVLDAIAAWIKKHGYSPSYKEIGAAVGLRSLATVACHLQRLRDKGYIHYGWNQTRSIEIIPASVRGWNFCDTGHDLVYFEGPGCPCCGLIINLPAEVGDITRRGNQPERVAARAYFYERAREKGFSLPAIARAVNRDHSTVLHSLRKSCGKSLLRKEAEVSQMEHSQWRTENAEQA